MDIFFSSDNNYVQHLCVTITSIIMNSEPDEELNFYILSDNISLKNRKAINNLKKIRDFGIKFIDVDVNEFKDCQINTCHITISTYFRFIIANVEPNLDKALYLDCDLVAVSSLKDLWNYDLEDNYCAAVQDLNGGANLNDAKRIGVETYFNAGVLLLNLRKWREENLVEQFFENAKKLKEQKILKYDDQDVLNYTFKDNVLWLNPKYNYQQNSYPVCVHSKYTDEEMDEAEKNTVIVHYNNKRKPWNGATAFYPHLYWKYLWHAGFYLQFFKCIFVVLFKLLLKNLFSCGNECIDGEKYRSLIILGIRIRFRKK